MPGNRSLDDFVAEEPTEDDIEPRESAADGRATTAGTADAEPAEPTVEPLVETFAWSAEGGPCAACGDRVERRWRDGEALVCADCKAW